MIDFGPGFSSSFLGTSLLFWWFLWFLCYFLLFSLISSIFYCLLPELTQGLGGLQDAGPGERGRPPSCRNPFCSWPLASIALRFWKLSEKRKRLKQILFFSFWKRVSVLRGDAQLTKALTSPFSEAREEALEEAAATMRQTTEAELKRVENEGTVWKKRGEKETPSTWKFFKKTEDGRKIRVERRFTCCFGDLHEAGGHEVVRPCHAGNSFGARRHGGVKVHWAGLESIVSFYLIEGTFNDSWESGGLEDEDQQMDGERLAEDAKDNASSNELCFARFSTGRAGSLSWCWWVVFLAWYSFESCIIAALLPGTSKLWQSCLSWSSPLRKLWRKCRIKKRSFASRGAVSGPLV